MVGWPSFGRRAKFRAGKILRRAKFAGKLAGEGLGTATFNICQACWHQAAKNQTEIFDWLKKQ